MSRARRLSRGCRLGGSYSGPPKSEAALLESSEREQVGCSTHAAQRHQEIPIRSMNMLVISPGLFADVLSQRFILS
jgi:hypothetical protein